MARLVGDRLVGVVGDEHGGVGEVDERFGELPGRRFGECAGEVEPLGPSGSDHGRTVAASKTAGHFGTNRRRAALAAALVAGGVGKVGDVDPGRGAVGVGAAEPDQRAALLGDRALTATGPVHASGRGADAGGGPHVAVQRPDGLVAVGGRIDRHRSRAGAHAGSTDRRGAQVGADIVFRRPGLDPAGEHDLVPGGRVGDSPFARDGDASPHRVTSLAARSDEDQVRKVQATRRPMIRRLGRDRVAAIAAGAHVAVVVDQHGRAGLERGLGLECNLADAVVAVIQHGRWLGQDSRFE